MKRHAGCLFDSAKSEEEGAMLVQKERGHRVISFRFDAHTGLVALASENGADQTTSR